MIPILHRFIFMHSLHVMWLHMWFMFFHDMHSGYFGTNEIMCRAECYNYGPMGSCPEWSDVIMAQWDFILGRLTWLLTQCDPVPCRRMDNAVVPCGSLLLDTPVRQCMHKVLGAQFEIGRVNITCISAWLLFVHIIYTLLCAFYNVVRMDFPFSSYFLISWDYMNYTG